jgi:Tfp pilus assembly protein PilF
MTVSPNNATAAYNLALLAYRQKRLDEARAWMRPVMQQQTVGPEALYLGMCIERKQGDRQSELSYTSQLRNRYPDSAEAKAVATGVCE